MASLVDRERFRRIKAEFDRRNADNPGSTFEEYRDARLREFLGCILPTKTVYLDMKYWIWLREPEIAPEPEKCRYLLSLLKNGVLQGKLLCPISYPIFSELMNIHPLEKKIKQARLMDSLCKNVSLRNLFDIADIEYRRFLSHLGHRLPASFQVGSVWSPIGLLLGELYPHNDLLPRELLDTSRKFVFEALCSLSVENLSQLNNGLSDIPALASRVNYDRSSFPRRNKPFSQLFAEELHGLLEVAVVHVEDLIRSTFGFSGNAGDAARNMLVNLLREAAIRDSSRETIPSLCVQAALNAAIRMDDRRPHRENDFHDILHASAAVTCCDVFLTERSLSEMVNRSDVRTRIPSKCKCYADINQGIRKVQAILASA